MQSNGQSPAVFEKTVKSMPRPVANIGIGCAVLLIIVGTPVAFVMNSAPGVPIVVGLVLLGFAFLARTPDITTVRSDIDYLTLIWSNGASTKVPWSEITDLSVTKTGRLAADVFFNLWTSPSTTVTIKWGKRSLSLSGYFGDDRDFVEKMKNHPMLQQTH